MQAMEVVVEGRSRNRWAWTLGMYIFVLGLRLARLYHADFRVDGGKWQRLTTMRFKLSVEVEESAP